jgi:ubiquinone/menaquinone biosynthesis C-methylase UbiE
MNNNISKRVKEMYIKNNTLSKRQNLHDKYSVNKYGWHNWVFDQYEIKENINILELGSGSGTTWIGKENKIPLNVNIILSDISPLMIEKLEEKFNGCNNFSFEIIDIQNILFGNEVFDIVIANHMLYHVPDIKKGLFEIKRVLKKDGVLYTTTLGENSLIELQDIYKEYKNEFKFQYTKNCSFTMENGENILKSQFNNIKKIFYIDSLEVTDINDLMEYIISYNKINKDIYNKIYENIKNKFNENNIFKIRKEQGMFICKI